MDFHRELAAVAADAKRERAVAEAALGAAFAADDYPAARRHATRLRYLGRLAEEARRRSAMRAA